MTFKSRKNRFYQKKKVDEHHHNTRRRFFLEITIFKMEVHSEIFLTGCMTSLSVGEVKDDFS